MQRLSPATSDDSETEYRAIEAALLESARGRWLLAEHGRRARRLDSALFEDAIVRLQSSLRQPPALLVRPAVRQLVFSVPLVRKITVTMTSPVCAFDPDRVGCEANVAAIKSDVAPRHN
jgi:hypothetical protein